MICALKYWSRMNSKFASQQEGKQMSDPNIQTQGTQQLIEPIIIVSAPNLAPQIVRTARICWNTGEEKNCLSCYLGKNCKAKS
jgi:hypothetical protein